MSEDTSAEPVKPTLTPANENPWYVLATIHGEQSGDRIDVTLAENNRETWNRYYAETLTDEQKADLLVRGVAAKDLFPLNNKEKAEITKQFYKRINNFNGKLPILHYNINFNNVLFQEDTIFEGFIFSKIINLTNAIFLKKSYFGDVFFLDLAIFKSVFFTEWAYFRAAIFKEGAAFNAVTASGGANFSSVIFMKWANFNSGNFSKSTIFIDASFKSHTSFAQFKFLSHVPDFRGASLHEATEWHGASWPSVPADTKACQQQVYCYERLKLEMERLKKHEDELAFFAREMRARRGLLERWSFSWWLNTLYGGLSHYGLDASGALSGLFLLFAYGAMALMIIPLADGSLLSFGTAHGLSFANMLYILSIKKEAFGDTFVQALPTLAHVIGAAQAALSTLFLFLLGLRIRNMFRLR